MDNGDDLICPNCDTNCDHVDARIKSGSHLSVSDILNNGRQNVNLNSSSERSFNSRGEIPSHTSRIKENNNISDSHCLKPKPSTNHMSQRQSTSKKTNSKLKEELQLEDEYRYCSGGTQRGYCLVVNMEHFESYLQVADRIGTGKDTENIERSFGRLQFNCYTIKDPTVEKTKNALRKMASMDHSNNDCFACVILTHGEDNGVLYAKDGKLKLDDLISPFKGDACPTLVGKPKLFFVQACRGNKLDHGVLMTDGDDSLDDTDGVQPVHRIPSEADFLLAFSVIPGYFSWRNSSRGSWFIQALAEMLDRFGSSLDLLSILTRVSHRVAYNFESNASTPDWSQKKQIPCIVSMLTKDLYFPSKS